MKIKNTVTAVIAMLPFLFAGCKDEEPVTGFDPDLPGAEEIAYDAMNSSSESIAVTWDASRAVRAGATSFTVQLVTGVEAEGDIYDSAFSQNIRIDEEEGLYDLTQFINLTEGKIYYVRIRANYPGSRFSEWDFARNDAGEPARIKVGKGIVPDSEQESLSSVKVRVDGLSESTAIVEWSVTKFKNRDADKKGEYLVELYRDKACKDLEVSYKMGNIWDKYDGPRFQFTGLTPATSYFFRAKEAPKEGAAVEPEWSTLTEFKTLPSQFKEIPSAPAKEGEVILYQDFHELLWGGDYVRTAAGYSSQKRADATEIWKASGKDPMTNMADKGFYFVKASQDMNLFTTLGKSIPNTSLTTWGWMSEGNDQRVVCVHAGYLKMGGFSKCCWIVTPEFSCLPKSATIELSFSAAKYGADPGQVIVELLDGSTAEETRQIIPGSRLTVASIKVTPGWKTYKFTIDNVGGRSRIAIGGDRQGVDGQHRFGLDDIQVKVLNYGSVAVELTVPEGLAASDVAEKSVTLTWSEVKNAAGYVVEYRAEGAAEWTEAKAAEARLTIDGLEPDTAYEARVKAVSGESESAFSEPVGFKTKKGGGQIVSKLLNADESSLAVAWSVTGFKDVKADIEEKYTIELFRDQDCKDLIVKWSFKKNSEYGAKEKLWEWNSKAWLFQLPAQPAFKFTGLQPGTEYFVRVTDTDKEISQVSAYKTTASDFVACKTGGVKPGEVILHEDFHDLLWGGDPIAVTSGYSSINRGSADQIWAAAGEDPTADETKKFYQVNFSVEMGLFNTLQHAVRQTTLKDWGWGYESTKEDVSGVICARPGFVKLGASKAVGVLVTPALDCLPESAGPITIEFDLCPYREAAWDPGDVIVEVFSDYTVEDDPDPAKRKFVNRVSVKEGGRRTVQEIHLPQEYGWKHYTLQSEAAKGDRIAIGGNRKGRDGQHRFYMDNIQVRCGK